MSVYNLLCTFSKKRSTFAPKFKISIKKWKDLYYFTSYADVWPQEPSGFFGAAGESSRKAKTRNKHIYIIRYNN